MPRSKTFRESGHSPQTGSPERVSVIGPLEGYQPLPLRLAHQLPILGGHFQGDLNRRRPVIREKNARQRFLRPQGNQFCAQLRRLRVSESQERNMRKLLQLFLKRRIQSGMPVAVDIGPN